MKTAIVLNGCSTLLNQQLEELNSFVDHFLNDNYEIEVWILFNDKINKEEIKLTKKISKVKLIQTKSNYLPEEFLDVLQDVYTINKPKLILFGSDIFSSELSVRLAYRLKGSSCVGVKDCEKNKGKFFVEKPAYSNNLTVKLLLKKQPYCISIAKGFKDKVEVLDELPELELINYDVNTSYPWIKSSNIEIKDASKGLDTAPIVVAAGRGVGNKESIKTLKIFTDIIGGELGASRPVVMNAWTEMNKLIGASGSIISSDICIVIGASGAAAFTVGIEKCKWIVAINNDENAPIFKVADVAIVDDYKEILDELINILK